MNIRKSSENYLISMMVDNFPEHYFKAELLLFSLRKFGSIPSKNIIVQCVDRVDPIFKEFVQDSGYRFREVTPYLDGTYCNKLQQLDGLADEMGDVCGIFLLDVDMVLLDQLDIPCFDKVLGKIVDAPNPPIDVLERIFSAAEMPSPGRVPCDWGIGDTLATNFNGGFLFIPTQFVSTVSSLWRHWAEWLYQRPELFGTPQQRIHADQVAMALTLASGAVPYAPITANFNFPTHTEQTPRTFDDGAALRVLHYHTEINPFGLIEPTHGKTLAVQIAVAKMNEAVADKNRFTFFDGLKRHQAFQSSQTTKHSHPYLHATLSSLNSLQTRRRLILHAGTPKTGTSSLQSCLDQNRAAMLEIGLLYPHTDGSSRMPKHQWLVGCLINCDEHGFGDNLQGALKDIPLNIHTVILSTEGIFNHWWDYSSYAKSMLASLSEWFDIEVWVWFRAPEDFANSLYRQYLTNPRNSVGPCYGKDVSFQEMLGDPWFIRHFDYLGFIRDVQATFGEKVICPIVYTGDTVESFKNLMGITGLPGYRVRENLSIEQLGVELIRIINRQNLGAAAKSHASLLVKQLETLMEGSGKPFVLSDLDKSRIRAITALGNAVLKAEFGLCWEDVGALGSGVESSGSVLRHKQKLLAPYMRLFSDAPILDLGCGDIEITRYAPAHLHSGIDCSAEALAIARTKRLDGSFRIGEIGDVMEAAADLILCLDLLIHEKDSNRFHDIVKNLVRVARTAILVSGYETPPEYDGGTVFFHEALSEAFRRHGEVASVQQIGSYRDVSLLLVTKLPKSPTNPNDIDLASLAWGMAESPDPNLLRELVDMSRNRLGFFPKTIIRTIEYPWFAQRMVDTLGHRILDVGAGVSVLPLWLADRGAQVTTIDFHPRRRDPTERTDWNEWGFLDYRQIDPRILSVHGDVAQFASDAPFDSIYSVSVVEHMPARTRRAALARMADLLVPGGRLFLSLDLVPGTDALWPLSEGVTVDPYDDHGSFWDVLAELQISGIKAHEWSVRRNISSSRTDLAFIIAEKYTS